MNSEPKYIAYIGGEPQPQLVKEAVFQSYRKAYGDDCEKKTGVRFVPVEPSIDNL